MDTALYFWKANNVKSAVSAKMTPLSVDFDAKTGVFPSSSGNKTYVCTLEWCPCTDFSINRKPCKHMIRLAHELHVITLDGVQSSRADAEEKKNTSIADAFIKTEPLSNVLFVFKAADALVNGEIVSDDQIKAVRCEFPFFVTENGTFNSDAYPVYQSMKARLDNRLGLLLVNHIDALPDELINTLCRLDNPSSKSGTPSAASDMPDEDRKNIHHAKKANRPSVSMDDLLSQLDQKGITFKDMRPSGGCLWVESTGRSDAMLKGISVEGFYPVLIPESRHFNGRRAWYIKNLRELQSKSRG